MHPLPRTAWLLSRQALSEGSILSECGAGDCWRLTRQLSAMRCATVRHSSNAGTGRVRSCSAVPQPVHGTHYYNITLVSPSGCRWQMTKQAGWQQQSSEVDVRLEVNNKRKKMQYSAIGRMLDKSKGDLVSVYVCRYQTSWWCGSSSRQPVQCRLTDVH